MSLLSLLPQANTRQIQLLCRSQVFLITDRTRQQDLNNKNNVTAAWVRVVGSASDMHSVWDGKVSQTQQTGLVQIGSDIANGYDSDNKRWHVGLMAGYGGAKTKASVDGNPYKASGTVSGFSVGIYGT